MEQQEVTAGLLEDVRAYSVFRYIPEHDRWQLVRSAPVLDGDGGRALVDQIEGFVRFSLPLFQRVGKLYLTIGVGCTGVRHRSVAVVEELGRRLGEPWHMVVRHRDLGRG